MIMPGYPREIADDFSPDNSSYERVPDNLDSVYYDSARGKLLFFKGEDVSMYRRMDGWMGGYVGGWVGMWVDGWIDGGIYGGCKYMMGGWVGR